MDRFQARIKPAKIVKGDIVETALRINRSVEERVECSIEELVELNFNS